MSTATSAAAAGGAHGHNDEHSGASLVECNICLDTARDPVVTFCGHLFCWPCLYRWLRNGHNVCPVCKAGVSRENVIPLYGRGSDARFVASHGRLWHSIRGETIMRRARRHGSMIRGTE